MSSRDTLLSVLLWSLMAGLGGVVRFVARTLQNSGQLEFTRQAILIYALKLFGNAVISGFCGLMGALAVSTLTADTTWHLVAAGVFGYLGIEGLEFLSQTVKRKFPAS